MEDTIRNLSRQQLIDRALESSWLLGLSAGTELWATQYWDREEHYILEEEKFEFRRELFRRLELLDELLTRSNKAFDQLLARKNNE